MTRAHRQDRDHQAAGSPDRHLAIADPPPPGSPGPRPPGGDIATTEDRQVATHRIVTTDRQTGAPPSRAADMLAGFRFMAQSLEAIDYARNGAYSIHVDGWWRNANIFYAYWIAIPGIVICEAVKWAFFGTLSRTLVAFVVVLLTLMLLNGLPVVHWLIPDAADFTMWWATTPPPTGAVG